MSEKCEKYFITYSMCAVTEFWLDRRTAHVHYIYTIISLYMSSSEIVAVCHNKIFKHTIRYCIFLRMHTVLCHTQKKYYIKLI